MTRKERRTRCRTKWRAAPAEVSNDFDFVRLKAAKKVRWLRSCWINPNFKLKVRIYSHLSFKPFTSRLLMETITEKRATIAPSKDGGEGDKKPMSAKRVPLVITALCVVSGGRVAV